MSRGPMGMCEGSGGVFQGFRSMRKGSKGTVNGLDVLIWV